MNPLNTLRSMLRPLALTAAFSATLALAGCGGGGGGGEDGDEQQIVIQQVTITSTPELDGVVFGSATTVQGRTDLAPHVGDFAFNAGQGPQRLQAIYSFDLSDLPEGAVIRSATLNVSVTDIIGEPVDLLSAVRLDHINFGTTFPQNFGPIVLDGNVAVIQNMGVLGLKQANVTEQVQDDMDSNRTRSQYRFRGVSETNGDNVADAVEMSDGEGSTGGQNPVLILEIEVPVTE